MAYYRNHDRNKAAHAARARAVYSQNMAIVSALKSAPCVDCGRTFPPECMDWDHVHGRKRRDVGKMLHCSITAIMAEIAKCELVCANCHRIRTARRRSLG